jgi:hypothetical protein
MAQVINPGRRNTEGVGGALTRLFQMYSAYKGAQASGAETDLANTRNEAMKLQQADTQAGFIPKEKQFEAAKEGWSFSDQPSEGALAFKDREVGQLYATPPKPKDSVLYQKTDMLSKAGRPVNFDPRTGAYIEAEAPSLAQASQPDMTPYQKAQLALEREKLGVAKAKDKPLAFEDKVKGLNASDRARFDNIKMASKAVQDMGEALGAGQSTYSLIGDNDFTIAQREFAEALGRMQSGGAISKDEESRFASMAPKFTDSAEVKQSKLLRLQDEMKSRLGTLGFQYDEVSELAQRQSPVRQKGKSGTAIAAPVAPSKPLEKMTDAELDAELKRLKGGK